MPQTQALLDLPKAGLTARAVIPQQINDFITVHGKLICDRCITTALELTALAHSAQITAVLGTTSDFSRLRSECSVCQKERMVIRACR